MKEIKVDLIADSTEEQQNQLILSWNVGSSQLTLHRYCPRLPILPHLQRYENLYINCMHLDRRLACFMWGISSNQFARGPWKWWITWKKSSITKDMIVSADEKWSRKSFSSLSVVLNRAASHLSRRLQLALITPWRSQAFAHGLWSHRSIVQWWRHQPKQTNDWKSGDKVLCQICSRKGHNAINYYNHINFTKFPATHGRVLTLASPVGMKS